MPRIHERFKRVFREGAGGRQKQHHITPAVPSASITATGSTHAQQEQSGDSFASTPPAKPQQPPAAQSLWDHAYDALAKEMPDLVKRYDELLAKEEQMANSVPDQTMHPQLPAPHGLDTRPGRSRRQVQLNTVIQNGLQRMEDNKATFKIAGHEIDLGDKITKAANILLWGKDFIGSAVKNSPEASLVWSGVSLVLPLLTNPTIAAEANRDGFAYVTSRMRYYVALEPMLRRLGQNAKVDEALISATNCHVVDLYQAILEFQISSVLRFYQSRYRTYVHDTVPSRDWEQARLDIKTREDTVNSDFGQINQLGVRQELELLNNTSEDTHATLENCLSVATQQLTVSKLQLAAQEDAKHEKLVAKQHNCLQQFYLTPNGNGATYDWYKGRVECRVEGTCDWFLRHEYFHKWLSQESGPLLVSADPGCGKSVLAKYLIDHKLAQQSATICYFFFKDQDQNTIRQALCALLHQLFSQKSALIQHAMELYNNKGAKLVESEESLWTILRDAVRDPQAGSVIFVIDALDECDESQLSSLTPNLKSIFCDQQLAAAKFKVLMTSRPYKHVVSEFRSLRAIFQHIRIPGEEEFESISQEINSVIHHRVEQLAEKHELSDKIRSSLASKLLAIDHRTYLWVYLVFDYLDKAFNKGFKTTEDSIDAAIGTLPKSVNQAYDQMLNRSQDVATVKTVKKVLSMILAARRPLTLSEMNIAMNLDGQARGLSIYDLDLEQDTHFKTRLRTLCGLFINVHHDKIYFLHQTAREFLIQTSTPTTLSSDLQWHHSITTRHAHSVLAEVCMFYLDRLNSTHTQTFCQDDHHGALFQYSVQYWDDHCREAKFEKSSAMIDLALGLCTPDLTSHSQWASTFTWRYHIRPESCTNVLVASHLGLTPVAELLLSRGADIEAKDSQGRTALMLAAESGHEAVTELLLDSGANVGVEHHEGWTALMFAAKSGHEAAARLLLELGAGVKTRDKYGRTALMLAAKSGHEAVTRLLIKNGAAVEARHDDGWTALLYAARYGHEAVTRLLLEHGADIEAKNKHDRTALMLASKSGHEDVTRLLLENGADAEAKNDDGWTSLMHAADSGHGAVARLLLENGANTDAKDNFGWTALIHAAGSGYEAVIRLLLEHGANIEVKHNGGWSALMIAARYGHEAVTRLMLADGADVEARQDDGWTALILAAKAGHEAVTQLLLENGANIDARDGDGWTALMHAAFCQKSITRLLLANGADIEAKNNDGVTALLYAARAGHKDAMRLLLESGANAEAKDECGRTVLMLAAESGDEAVTRLLLDHGADLVAKDEDGWTSLMFAARAGHEAVTRLLLESGADVEGKDDDGRTALIFAVVFGHEATTRLLLENGADVGAKPNNGWTALMIAAEYGHEAVTRLLLENGAALR